MALLPMAFYLNVNADSITNYSVKQRVPIDKLLTVTGNFNADLNANVLCKFLILESDGNTLLRLTDEYTFSDGTFYTEKTISEPEFKRGRDYNASTTCGAVTSTAVFSVIQREAISETVQSEIEFIFLKNNINPLLFLGSAFILLLLLIFIWKYITRVVK